MAEDFRLSAETRTLLGSGNARRIRKDGRVPANIYGLQKDTLSLTVSAEQVEKMVATGSRVVDVEHAGNVEKAVIQELQWDIYSSHVKHVDLQRVDADAVTTVEVPLRIRGEAIGLKDGGQLRQLIQKVTVTCPAYRVPKSLTARVGTLKIGKHVTVSELERPDGVTVETDGEAVVIEMFDPKKAAEAAEVAE